MKLAPQPQAAQHTQAPPAKTRRILKEVARLSLLTLTLLLLAGSAFAQSNSLADRLPADTWAYLSWGGTNSLQAVSSTNSLVRLWADPSFRAWLENTIGTVSHPGGPTQPLFGMNPGQTAEFFSILENSAVVGFTNKQEANGGYFLIYDATGKQDLLDTLRRERDAKSPPLSRSSLPVGDVTVEKRQFEKSVTYEAQAGPYLINTNSLAEMEELLPRFESRRAPTAPFTAGADFPAECRELSRPGILNVLVLPTKMHPPAAAEKSGFDFQAFSSYLHLDRIRAGCMSVSVEKQITRTRGLVLGDMSQGSILNIMGDNRGAFATMALASSNSAFHVSVIDFPALYNALFGALSAGLASKGAPMLAAGVAFLTSSWGMPPDQFFALFTGETANVHPDTTVDPSASVFALTIREPQQMLHVLQHALPGEHATIQQAGDVTYLTISFPQTAAASSPMAPSAVYLALTPNMLLGSKDEGVLHHAVARAHSAAGQAPSNTLTADPDFRKARASLPAKLASLSYDNYSRFNWQKFFSDAEKSINDQAQARARLDNKPAPPPIHIFQGFNAAAFSNYLHVSISGAWKDSNGIYFDSYIQ
jgi:hypothetical protein